MLKMPLKKRPTEQMLISAANHRMIERALMKGGHDQSLSATKRMELRGLAKRARAVADRAEELEKR